LIALNLALAAIVFGDYESAERWQNAAEARAADHPYVRLGRVLLTLQRGRTGDAVAQAERFLADQPGSFLALEALTQARLHAGHYELARPHLEAMRRVAPGDWNFWGLTHRSLYGWTLLKLGDADGGVEVLHELLRDARVRLAEGDERPGLLREIAAIHAALGERQRALEWLARAIDAGWRLDQLHPSPLFEPIRAEQGYSQLMARVAVSLRRMSGRIEKSEIWSGPS
jgi:tetratricopeptide (TPR) repeat protein